jgi:Mn2+/Fe2+ NRAMP family transporter
MRVIVIFALTLLAFGCHVSCTAGYKLQYLESLKVCYESEKCYLTARELSILAGYESCLKGEEQ